MSDNKDYMDSISGIVAELNALVDAAYVQYSSCVDAILRDELTDIVQIEKVVDGLCDFGADERFLELYKRLCRHIYQRYPQLVGEHICWAWRQIWADMKAEDEDKRGESDVCS